jgi:hypothetical protein
VPPDNSPGADSGPDSIAAQDEPDWARVIKVSDFTHNAVGLLHTTGPKLRSLARKCGAAERA